MSLARAELLLQAHRYAQAGALLSRAVAEDPDDPRAWTLLGRAHLGLDDPASALDALDAAVRLAPDDYPVLYVRGYALSVSGRFAEAEESLRAAIRAAPHAGATYALLSRVLAGRPGRGREAYDLALEAVGREPGLADAHLAVCLAAAAIGDEATCRRALDETLRREPDNETAQLLITTIRATAATAGRATTLIADTLAANPHLTDLLPQLDEASYRLLRGIRWLAVPGLLLAGVVLDLFPGADDPVVATLPIDLPERLGAVAFLAVVFGAGTAWRLRRLRAGARLHVRALLRRGRWSRIVAAQTVLLVAGALLIVLPPWRDRSIPEVIFLVAFVPTLATVLFDKRRRP